MLASQPLEIANLSSWLYDSFLLCSGLEVPPDDELASDFRALNKGADTYALPTSFASNASKWSSSRWSSAMPERKHQM